MTTFAPRIASTLQFIAFLCAAALATGCGDEDLYESEVDLDTYEFALDAEDSINEADGEGAPDDAPINDDETLEAPQGHDEDFANDLRFDSQRHRVKTNTVLSQSQLLARFKEFEFDCQDGADQCNPADHQHFDRQ